MKATPEFRKSISNMYDHEFDKQFVTKEYGVGYAIENGIKRPLTASEKAVYDKHLRKALSECKEFK